MIKKGDFSFEQIGRILLIIAFFLILLIIVGLLINKGNSVFDSIKDFMRFR